MFVSCNSSTTGVTSGAALLTHPDHLNSPLVFSWFVQLNLQFSVQCCVDHCLSVCSFCVGYCIVCPSLVIALYVLLRWLLHCLSFFVGYCIVCPSSLVIALSVLRWLLHCMSFFVGYCIVCPSLVIALYVLLRWLLHCLSFFVGYCIVCPSSLVIALPVLLRFTASDYPFGIFKRFLNRKKKQFKETNTKSWLPIITNFKIQTSQASGLTVVSCLNLSLSQNSLVVRPLWIQNMLYGLPDTKKTMVCLNFNWIFK